MKKFTLTLIFLMINLWSYSQIINTIAGNGVSTYGGDGVPAIAASLVPNGITTDRYGNIYFVDDAGHRIRKITASTGIVTTVAGNGSTVYVSDGVPATSTAIDPFAVAVDTFGNIYIADGGNNRVRMVNTAGMISTIAGTGVAGYSGDTHAATLAQMRIPKSIAIDAFGNLYVGQGGMVGAAFVDYYVRKIVLSTGIITTYAGNGTNVYGGDGHLATWIGAGLMPSGLTTDATGNLYIADRQNNVVRKVNLHDSITTIAGTGVNGYSGDLVLATTSKLYYPTSVVVDASNNLYINDCGNYRIRKVNMSTGIITTYCGTGTAGFYGDGLPATVAKIANSLGGITADDYGLILSDYNNYRLRRICYGITVPTISITASSDTVCAGTTVSFTSSVSGSGTAPAYRWYINGTSVATGSTYSYVPSSGDVVKCVLTSNATCAFPDTAASATVTMVVNPIVTPTISISASATIVCSGTSVSFTSTITGGGSSPAYQWKVNGINVGTASAYSYIPANGDVVKCVLTSSLVCATIATSSSIILTVNPLVLPTILISPSATTVCAGTPVNFTSSITGGGTSPAYQWKVNGINVGTASTYSYSPANGDVVQCVLTSSATCTTIVTSSSITMTVNPTVLSTVLISPSATTVCAGTPVNFSSSITNGGSSPSYQWKVNSISVGTGSTYSYLPANGDIITCSLTSSATCATPLTVLSGPVTLVVNPLPIIYSFGGSGTYLDTGLVTLSNSQAGVTYQLYNGSSAYGLPVPGSGSVLTFYVTISGTYSIVATETLGGCTDTTASSANMIINPSLVPNLNEPSRARIYPNPANDQLNIEDPQLYEIQIMDLTGRVLISKSGYAAKFTIDIARLKSGLYLVKLNGQYVQKFTKE